MTTKRQQSGRPDIKTVFKQLDEAGLPEDLFQRDNQPDQERDFSWMSEDYSDEPHTDGKSALDLFRESCEAADRERRDRTAGTENSQKHSK